MKARVALVSPSMAREWLQKNTNNRPLRKPHVERFERELRRGSFDASTDGVGFDIHGNLVNSQHRLHAIANTGISAEMVIVEDIKPRAVTKIDNGVSRSAVDAASYQGLRLTNLHAAIVRAMVSYGRFGLNGAHGIGQRSAKIDNAAVIDLYVKYKAHVDFAYGSSPNKHSPISGPVLAVVARAHLAQEGPEERLLAFVRVLETAVPDDAVEDTAALVLGAFLRDHKQGGGTNAAMDKTTRTEQALWNFLARRDVKLCRPVSRPYWPMPEDAYLPFRKIEE